MTGWRDRLRSLDQLAPDDVVYRRAQEGPRHEPPDIGPSRAKRLTAGIVAFALFAASGAFLLDRFSSEPERPADTPDPSVSGSAADAFVITCAREGVAQVGGTEVALQSDGVHLQIDNRAHEAFVYIRDPEDAGRSYGFGLAGEDLSDKALPVPPGTWVAGCFSGQDRNTRYVPVGEYSVPVEVVDPNGYWPLIQEANTCGEDLPAFSSGVGQDDPIQSPIEGTMIVDVRDPDSGLEAGLSVSADGSNPLPLLELPPDVGDFWSAALSPDGTKVALVISDSDGDPTNTYASKEDGEIWLANADGSNLTKLTDNHSSELLVEWMPGGDRLSFASNRVTDQDEGRTLYSMNLEGGDVRPLLPPGWEADRAAWSPDGSTLAFVGHDQGNESGCQTGSEIYVMPANGSAEPVALTDDELWEQSPAWSPDGSKIAYMVSDQSDERWDIMVMNADGSGAVRLTDHRGFDAYPVWSPDGSSIVFTSDRGLPGQEQPTQGGYPWIMNTDGSGVRPLFTPADLGYADGWSVSITDWRS